MSDVDTDSITRTCRVPSDPPPTPEERMKKNQILVAGYLGLHLLVFFLSLPLMMLVAVVLVVMNVVVGFRVSTRLDTRLREDSYVRNLRLLNPFHYRPDIEEQIVNAFVELIAPETEQELHTD